MGRRTTAGVMIALAALVAAGPASAPSTGDDPALTAKLDRHLPQVRLKANDLSDVVDFLRDVSGVNILVRWDALATVNVKRDTPITFSANDVPFGHLLKTVLDQAAGGPGKLTHGVVGQVVVLTTPADLKRVRARFDRHAAAGEPAAVCRMQPQVRSDGIALSDVVDFLRDSSGVAFRPDWAALKAAGVDRDAPVTVNLRAVPLNEAVGLILDSVGDDKHPLDYRVEPDGSITISTAAALGTAGGAAGPTTR